MSTPPKNVDQLSPEERRRLLEQLIQQQRHRGRNGTDRGDACCWLTRKGIRCEQFGTNSIQRVDEVSLAHPEVAVTERFEEDGREGDERFDGAVEED